MKQKQIALIGAGKLGKGYIADLFGQAGYEVIFLVRRQQQCVRWVLQVRLHMTICSREMEMRHIATGSLMLFII